MHTHAKPQIIRTRARARTHTHTHTHTEPQTGRVQATKHKRWALGQADKQGAHLQPPEHTLHVFAKAFTPARPPCRRGGGTPFHRAWPSHSKYARKQTVGHFSTTAAWHPRARAHTHTHTHTTAGWRWCDTWLARSRSQHGGTARDRRQAGTQARWQTHRRALHFTPTLQTCPSMVTAVTNEVQALGWEAQRGTHSVQRGGGSWQDVSERTHTAHTAAAAGTVRQRQESAAVAEQEATAARPRTVSVVCDPSARLRNQLTSR